MMMPLFPVDTVVRSLLLSWLTGNSPEEVAFQLHLFGKLVVVILSVKVILKSVIFKKDVLLDAVAIQQA